MDTLEDILRNMVRVLVFLMGILFLIMANVAIVAAIVYIGFEIQRMIWLQ